MAENPGGFFNPKNGVFVARFCRNTGFDLVEKQPVVAVCPATNRCLGSRKTGRQSGTAARFQGWLFHPEHRRGAGSGRAGAELQCHAPFSRSCKASCGSPPGSLFFGKTTWRITQTRLCRTQNPLSKTPVGAIKAATSAIWNMQRLCRPIWKSNGRTWRQSTASTRP